MVDHISALFDTNVQKQKIYEVTIGLRTYCDCNQNGSVLPGLVGSGLGWNQVALPMNPGRADLRFAPSGAEVCPLVWTCIKTWWSCWTSCLTLPIRRSMTKWTWHVDVANGLGKWQVFMAELIGYAEICRYFDGEITFFTKRNKL